MDSQTAATSRSDTRRFLNTTITLSMVVSGVVLFPMLGSKSNDPSLALALWMASPVLVTLGICGYANFYLGMVRSGALRQAWTEGARDFAASTRYITVMAAVAYLVGFFFDPNGM